MIRKLIEKPIAVTMTLIAIVVLGVVAAGLLPVSLMPDVAIPHITVQVAYPGNSARQLDAAVIAPLQRELMQVGSLKEIRSNSRDDRGSIYLQFEYGADIDFLFIEVNEKIDRAMNNLPREMERPRVVRASATDIPVFYLNVRLKDAAPHDTFAASNRFAELSALVSQVIAKRLEAIPQVAMADISGLVYPEILIVPRRERMEALGLTTADLEAVIRSNNITLGNLSIRDGEYTYSIRFENTVTGREDIENLYLKIGGRLFRLGELAEVIEQPQPRTGIVRADGRQALTLAVIKQSDARMKDLKEEVAELLESLRADYPGAEFEVTRDQTQLLEYSIGNLRDNILLAAVLATLVLLLFMSDLRSPALVAITIPLTLIVSFLFFHLLGITINVISLSGLILGTGMIVDNSIIVIDNITQYWQRGMPLRAAVARGAGEVFAPMLSSVLTTVSVFVPLIFLSGIAGALFYDQAMAVSIGLLASLGVAVLVIPVYYLLFNRKLSAPSTNRYLKRIDITDRMTRVYERGLKYVFRHQAVMWTLFAAMIPLTWVLYRVLDKERMPPLTRDDIVLTVDWNDPVSAEENDRRIGGLLEGVADLTTGTTVLAGPQQFVLAHTAELTSSESVIYLRGKQNGIVPQIEERLSAALRAEYPEASFGFAASGNLFELIFADAEAPLTARLRQRDGQAPSPDKLNTLLESIARQIPGIPFEPVLWNEHRLLTARRDRMMLYGVGYDELHAVLRNTLNQNTLFSLTNEAIPVPVLSGENRPVGDILQGHVMNRDSVAVPLHTLLLETRSRDLKSIVSGPEGNYYPLPIEAGARQIPRLMERIRETVNRDGQYDVEFGGSWFTNRAMILELVVVLLISLLLLYFILAAQFESLVQPLIILSEVVVDIAGAFFFLWLFGSSINLMSLIGLVVMSGIIINDSILKVDTINKMRREGYSLLRAVMTAGVRRLKPIVMTSLTTILALVPFLSRGDMGSDLQYPLSLALIGGMLVGTIVSVFFIPLFYYQIYKRKG
jgi:multidrug efflux pump subunit AcrB